MFKTTLNEPCPKGERVLSTPDMQGTILVIEDRVAGELGLERMFRAEGYDVHSALDGRAGLEVLARVTPAAIIVDVDAPGMLGVVLCRELMRTIPSAPIIIFSSNSDVETKIQFLETGASDYVTKPFHPFEVIARVRAAIRRPYRVGKKGVVAFDDVTVNLLKMEVVRNGRTIPLSVRNFKLLGFLLRNAGSVISRTKLQKRICNNKHPRSVDNQIVQLRKKLEQNPSSPVHFRTVQGVGYKFVP